LAGALLLLLAVFLAPLGKVSRQSAPPTLADPDTSPTASPPAGVVAAPARPLAPSVAAAASEPAGVLALTSSVTPQPAHASAHDHTRTADRLRRHAMERESTQPEHPDR
jgi:hypothetical protein